MTFIHFCAKKQRVQGVGDALKGKDVRGKGHGKCFQIFAWLAFRQALLCLVPESGMRKVGKGRFGLGGQEELSTN